MNKYHLFFIAAALIIATAAYTSCKKEKKDVAVSGVSLNKTVLTLAEGASERLTATVAPPDATIKEVSWKSSAEGVATVDPTGNVTAVKAGSAIITATTRSGAKTATCAVTVTPTAVAVTGITISPADDVTVEEGKTVTLSATVAPADASVKAVTWSSLNADVAAVNAQSGVVTGVSEGEATIRATAADDSGVTADKTVTVTAAATTFTAVTDIVGVPSTTPAGTPLTLTGTVVPDDATNQTIAWSVASAGTTGATVSDGNTLNTAAAGTVSVRATIANGASATTDYTQDFSIAVTAPFTPATNITGVPAAATVGIPLTLTGTVAPDDATNKTIAWSIASAGGTGAAISGGNTFNATAAGTAKVRATIANGASPASDYTQEFDITVNAAFVAVTDIADLPSTATVGVPLTLTGTIVPGNATNQTIAWMRVSGPAATVSGNTLTADGAGTLVMRAIVENGQTATTNFAKDFNITVSATFVPVTNITGVPASATAGTPLTLTGTVVPADATNKTVTWSVRNAGTTGAAISGGNILNATAAGTARVRATIVNGASATANYTQDFDITVNAAFVAVTDITGLPSAATVNVPLTLTGTVVPSTATNQTIAWMRVSGPAATVSGNTLTATGAGTLVMRAIVENGQSPTTNFAKDFNITVSAATKTVSVGAQSGTLTAGVNGSVTFPVTVTGIANGSYTVTVANRPAGVTVQGQVAISGNSGTLTLAGNTSTVAGNTNNLTLTIDGATSGNFALTIAAATPNPNPTLPDDYNIQNF